MKEKMKHLKINRHHSHEKQQMLEGKTGMENLTTFNKPLPISALDKDD